MQKILIVESSQDILDLFTFIFEADNLNVEGCNDVDSMFISLQSSVPDLMIIDVVRTGVNEKIICENIRKRIALKSIPIVITSTQKDQLNNYKLFCADDTIEKPFELNEVKKKIRSLLPA